MADITYLADGGSMAGQAASVLVNSTIAALPAIMAAVLVFILGWLLAILLSKIVEGLLKVVRFEEFLKSHRVEDAMGTVKLSDLFVKVVKIYVILVFLQVSVALVSLGALSIYLQSLLLYLPVLIGALLVVVAAALAGEYLKEKIMELGKTSYINFLARGSKFFVVLVGIITALDTAGFNTSLINSLLVTLVQAVIFGFGLAFGIAFGLGGQKDAQDVIGKVRKSVKV